ncbi:Caspase recruitment domain-containing protein 8 [Pteropus alecto]|uniref:Caspase recruitment domain-containing protein 8 n=1 Tax=Pteropus alecto TaxID=9402 RepID=L5L4D1_PTEAL|nr:Caspase recruitment domain-containing protein 8 [Pteropus alecto]
MRDIFFSGDVCSKERQLVPSIAVTLSSGFKPMRQSPQFLGPEGIVDVDLIDKSVNKYRAVVTVTIPFDSWSQHLAPDLQHHEQWMVAGPLLDISVEPGEAIAEIYLPPFISLPDGVGVSWFHVTRFKDEGMVLEPPARVEPFYAVLENPSFSLMRILLRIASGTRLSIPITSTTLISYHWNPKEIKFHLYLTYPQQHLANQGKADRFLEKTAQTLERFAVIRPGNSFLLKMELPFLVLEEKEEERGDF